MMGPTTAGSGADPAVLSVFQLLTLLSDPDKARAKLEELDAANRKITEDRSAADVIIAEAGQLLKEAKQRNEESLEREAKSKDMRGDVNLTVKLVDEDKKKFAVKVAAFDANSKARTEMLDARDRSLTKGQADLNESLAAHEQAMTAASAAAAETKSQAQKALEQANTKKDEYERKLTALRQLTS